MRRKRLAAAAIPRWVARNDSLEGAMRQALAAVALTGMTMLASAAVAQERAGDAALGAASGAVVLGPVGAVAGAIVGYTAGPSISHAWGLHHRRGPARRRSQV